QIEQAFDDMSRRYRAAGASLRPVHQQRCRFAILRGDAEEARKHQRAWKRAVRDWNSDCLACERHEQVRYLIFRGKEQRAVEHAGPILRGLMRCAEIPHHTCARLVLPLLRLGRVGEAAAVYRKGLPMVARNRNALSEVAEHLTFLVQTDNLAAA